MKLDQRDFMLRAIAFATLVAGNGGGPFGELVAKSGHENEPQLLNKSGETARSRSDH
jgi:hypothetical protein